MPEAVTVLVNEDDPAVNDYWELSPWPIELLPAGSRCADAWRWMYDKHPDHSYYGMVCDDNTPQTDGWHQALVTAAENCYIAYPNGKNTEFPLMRGVCCIGGDFVRAIGGVVLPGYQHNYVDVVLNTIGDDSGLMRPLSHIHVDHNHWRFDPQVVRDETYLRGSADQAADGDRHDVFMRSAERRMIKVRIAKALSK